MTHAVAVWPPEPARGCCGAVRRYHVCLLRVSVAVYAISSCRALPSHVSGTRPRAGRMPVHCAPPYGSIQRVTHRAWPRRVCCASPTTTSFTLGK
eukprot:1305713-Prymnesium_polylepis.1